MKRIRHAMPVMAFLLSLLFTATAVAGTVWLPTDGDMNPSKLFSDSGTYGIFEDTDTALTSVKLTFEPGDLISVSGNTFTNTTSNTSVTLVGGQAFRLGAMMGGSWAPDVGYFQDNTTGYLISFEAGSESKTLQIYLNDVTPVPEPSAWVLMALAMASVMLMRRRTHRLSAA